MRKSLTNKVLILSFIFILFLGAYAHAHEQSYTLQMRTLPKIIDVLTSENVNVNAWSIYAREDSNTILNRAELYAKAQTLKQQFNQFKWGQMDVGDEKQLKLSGTLMGKKYQETVTLLAYPYKNKYKTYCIYVVKGRFWNEDQWKTISYKINDRIESLFNEKNGKIFTWASGDVDGKMDVGMKKKARQLLHDLNATEVEKIENKTFVSLSAYNKQWKEMIQTNGNKMNVQVGLRQQGQQTTVTIGTPIITTEY